MNIRTILTIRFILITAVIILLASSLIYFFSADYREDDFYRRLSNKATNTAILLIDIDEVSADLLKRLEQDNPVSLPNEKIIIFNYNDSLIFTTDDRRTLTVNEQLLNQVRLEEEVKYRQGDYEVLGFLFKGKYDRFVVIAGATDIYGKKKLKNLLVILVIVFAISVLIASVSGWFFSGKALEPIGDVIKQVDDITISSLNLRVDEGNGNDEIARLAQTFNRMLSRLETSFNTQKSFIANASHELRTPLTAVTGQLEVVLLKERSIGEYTNAISSVLDDIRNLTKLSNKLLLLAQTSSEQRKNNMVPLRLDELIWQTKEEIRRHSPHFVINIDLQPDLDDETLTIDGDEQLIRVCVSNLIDNACKYSSDATVKIFIYQSGPYINVDFGDHGIGIPEYEQSKIFEPFYRGSNAASIKGHGIGLSMVKGILRLHNGSIIIESDSDGTIVTISLPFRKETSINETDKAF